MATEDELWATIREEFDKEDLLALKEVAKDRQDNSVSRRAALGAIGAGSLAAASGIVGNAAAQPDGNPGQIGTQNTRIDAWLDEADADSVETEKLSNEIRYAAQYNGANGGEQIQAALDDLGATNGTVIVDGAPDDLSGITAAEETTGWLLTTSLQIPSNTVLDFVGDPYLFLEGNADDNMIRNAAADSGDTTRNEHIYLDGPVRLDGNPENQSDLGNTANTAYLNHAIHFYKLDYFAWNDLTVSAAKFCMNVEDFTHGRAYNTTFEQVLAVGNGDGLHVMGPGQDFAAYGGGGVVTEDALAADSDASATDSGNHNWGRGEGGDLNGVLFDGFNFDADMDNGSILRVLASTGNTLENVTVRDCHAPSGRNAINIGYQSTPSPDECRNITVDNISISADQEYINIGHDIQNFRIYNADGSCGGVMVDASGQDVDGFRFIDYDILQTTDFDGFDFSSGTYSDVVIRQGAMPVDGAVSSTANAFYLSGGTFNEQFVVDDVFVDGYYRGIYFDDNNTIYKFPEVSMTVVNANAEFALVGSDIIVGGTASESASAETPQKDWPRGTVVDFTDSGDGSGTGVYERLSDGSYTQIGT